MAVRYVKDFEFPAASGYTKSATKVTGQMYAKGGEVKDSAPKAKGKGLMVVIGVGMPKKPPMKKAQGSYVDQDEYMRQLEERSPIQSGTYGKKKAAPAPKKKEAPRDIEASDLYDAEQLKRMERGYAKGGMTKAQKKIGKVMKEYKAGELHSGKDGPVVKNPKQAIAIALSEAGKSKKKYAEGGMGKPLDIPSDEQLEKKAWQERKQQRKDAGDKTKKPVFAKGGSVKHPDEAMDKALIKKMVKPEARKMKKGGQFEEDDNSDYLKSMYPEGGNQGRYMVPSDAANAKMSESARAAMYNRQKQDYERVEFQKEFDKKNARGSAFSRAQDRADVAKKQADYARKEAEPYKNYPEYKKGGAAKHPDEAMDKALIKKMVKPEARAMKSGGGVQSPLQSMKIAPRTPSMERAKAVPVASRTPMIQSPSMEAAAPAAAKMGVGIGESRPGKPNVGRIRAMMAKAASAAKPENAPSMMKRGGMTKGKC